MTLMQAELVTGYRGGKTRAKAGVWRILHVFLPRELVGYVLEKEGEMLGVGPKAASAVKRELFMLSLCRVLQK